MEKRVNTFVTFHGKVATLKGAEIHIRPEHNVLVAVLLGYLAHSLKVALHDLADRLIAVNIKVLASAEHIRLVHTHVNNRRMKEHFINFFNKILANGPSKK